MINILHTGAIVIINDTPYVLGAYWPEWDAWDLWRDGHVEMAVTSSHLLKIIEIVAPAPTIDRASLLLAVSRLSSLHQFLVLQFCIAIRAGHQKLLTDMRDQAAS